ncbi:MAG: phosphoribosylanthranilate isomerase [Bacteroidota bacterium]
MIKLKICGMRDAANIRAVAELKPDYMGFIFYEKSPRFVGTDFKIPVKNAVGVFVNESTERILEKDVSIVQLHGDETPAQCQELKDKGLTVIKAFSIDDDFDFAKTKDYKVDYFLFDTKGQYYGGNAKAFNWNKLREYDQKIPFFLSGGLNAENLKDLGTLKGMNLYAIDLNSGVEDSPGVKNIGKIKEVISLNIEH